MHVYAVKLNNNDLVHVEADSKGDARRIALAGVTVERLDGSQVLDLTRRGVEIVSAEAKAE